MTLQKLALFYRTIVLLAFDLKTYWHTEKSKSNLSLVGVEGGYQRKIKLKASAWIAKYHKNTLFSPTKQINMGIFCLWMSSKAPISSTQELPAQKHSEPCSSCLWIKQLPSNQRNCLPLCSASWWESLACFWFHTHQACTHLEGSGMTDVSCRCLLVWGFQTLPALSAFPPYCPSEKREWGTPRVKREV